jgi:YD repeat-containing protein
LDDRLALSGYGSRSGDLLIPSDDGTAVYVFSGGGRHLQTVHAVTGAVRYAFAYDAAGRLVQITDGDGNATTIEQDGVGSPTAIVGPYGQRTTLSLDANGYLASLTTPANEPYTFTATPDGLLTQLTDPRTHTYAFTYDPLGRLARDDDPAGGSKTLARSDVASGFEVTLVTAESRTTTYRVEALSTGG